jgi:hypothetical protein
MPGVAAGRSSDCNFVVLLQMAVEGIEPRHADFQGARC